MANERILVVEDDRKLRPVICAYLRSTPIVMLTARSEEPDIIVGLEMGADD